MLLIALSVICLQSFAQQDKDMAGKSSRKFDLRPGNKARAGFVAIESSDSYSDKRGHGFDFLTQPGSDKPFYFSVQLPEGNYKVTLRLGDKKAAAVSTVKAESRRLMLEEVKTESGQIVEKSFVVNLKDRKISGGSEVSLKPRELTKLDWDDKLSLEFSPQTALNTIQIERVDDQITVFLAGNSTVVNQEEEPWASWGQMIPRFFKPGVAIANHAESGLSLGSFINSRRLGKILSVIKPGDYVFVEFGHNDEKEQGSNDGAYKSYAERLRLFAREVKAKKAHLVILTPTARRSFDASGVMVNSHGDYPDAARKVAAEEGVPLIDLTLLTTKMYEALGVEGSKNAFVIYPERNLNDNTHFNPYGAYQIAKIVAQGIRDNKLGLAGYLIDMPFFDSAAPDPFTSFYWSPSLNVSTVKPDGN